MVEPSRAASDRPDHVDAARAMVLALLAVAGVWGLSFAARGVPPEGLSLLMEAAFFSIPLLYARAVKLPPLEASGFVRLGFGKIGLVLLASLGTMWLLHGLSVIEMDLFERAGFGEEVRHEVAQLDRQLEAVRDKGLWLAALLLCVAAPLCEETLFRGLVFRGFTRRFGVGVSLVFTTFFFTILHQTRVQAPMMILLGLYFGMLVRLTGSLWAGVIAHAANNSAVLIVTQKYGSAAASLRAPWWMYVLSAVVFVGAMTLLAIDRRGEARGASAA